MRAIGPSVGDVPALAIQRLERLKEGPSFLRHILIGLTNGCAGGGGNKHRGQEKKAQLQNGNPGGTVIDPFRHTLLALPFSWLATAVTSSN